MESATRIASTSNLGSSFCLTLCPTLLSAWMLPGIEFPSFRQLIFCRVDMLWSTLLEDPLSDTEVEVTLNWLERIINSPVPQNQFPVCCS